MLAKKYIFLFLMVFFFGFSMAQNRYVDSLKQNLSRNTSNIQKISVLELLVEKYRSERQYDQATTYAKELLQLAKKEKNTLEIVKAYTFLGIIANNEDQYGKASLYVDSTRLAASKDNNDLAKAYSRYLEAYQEDAFEDYKKAMSMALESLALVDSHGKGYNLTFKLYYMLYGIYTNYNDLNNSMKYAQLALKSALSSGNKNNVSNAYSALAVAYTYQYEKSEKKEDIDHIIKNAQIASGLSQRYPGQIANSTYAIALNNLASYYLMYFPNRTPELKKIITDNIEESLKISRLSTNTQPTQAGSLGMLANLAKESGEISKAENYLLEAEAILLTQKPIYYHMMIMITNDLSQLYKQKGELAKALEYQEKVTEFNGLLFNKSQSEAVKKIEAQYQSVQKEKEVKQQKKEKLWLAGGILLTILGGFFMFRSYHFRLRYSLEREKQLSLEKNEVNLQINFEKEEQARLKAEQELLSLQQEKLQNEVLINQLHIQHKNNVLHQLKEKLEDDKNLNINSIIREENFLDKDFDKARFDIQEVHPNFFKSLNDKAKSKLTELDLKYCAYMHLGMNTKQIANLLNVEPKSVNMTKYRLKKKFDLNADTDLVQFIKGII